MTYVDGVAIPLRRWEGEVLLRAVGVSAIVRGIGLSMGCLSSVVLYVAQGGTDWISALVPVAVGSTLVIAGQGLFLRSHAAWCVLIWLHILQTTCLGCTFGLIHDGLLRTAAADIWEPLFPLALPTWMLPDLFALYILAHPGRDAIGIAWREEPLAPLATIITNGPTARALAALGLIVLSVLHAVLYVLLAVLPFLDPS